MLLLSMIVGVQVATFVLASTRSVWVGRRNTHWE